MNENKEIIKNNLIKILLLGDTDVGKSSILKQFIDGIFSSINACIIGTDFRSKTINLSNSTSKLLIFDSVGQSRFRNITRSYYNNTQVFIFVYSITDDKSFEEIDTLLYDVNLYASKDIIKILVGNKTDLELDRKVLYEQVKIYAKENNFDNFYETSAKENINIQNIFLDLIKIYEKKFNKTNNFIRLQIQKDKNKINKKRFSC